jgi:hypothetical protein
MQDLDISPVDVRIDLKNTIAEHYKKTKDATNKSSKAYKNLMMEQAITGAEAIAREKERISSSYKLKTSGRSENSSPKDKGFIKYPVPKGLINQRSNKEQIDLSLSRVESDLEPTKPITW